MAEPKPDPEPEPEPGPDPEPPNAARSSSSARSATAPAAATAESRRAVEDAPPSDAPPSDAPPSDAPSSPVVSPPRVSMASFSRRSGESVASHSGSFVGGFANPATPRFAAAARAASRDASRSVLSTSCRLCSAARRSAFSLASFAFHRALLSRMYACTSAFRRSDSSRRSAASRASESGADVRPDADPGRRIPARHGLFASRAAFRAARASAVSPGPPSSGPVPDGIAAHPESGVAADGGRNTADVDSTSASSPERGTRLARVSLCFATRSASFSTAACRLARSSSASAAAFLRAAASANASFGGGSATSTMAAAPSSSPSSSAACEAMRERSSERASMWADLASRSGLGRAGDLDGATGTLDESHGLSEMGLDEALVFALPDPDAREARWTASGGVGGSIAPSFAAASAAASAALMPANRTFRPRREDANARNAASPGAPRRTTSNDRERAPATPTPPFALRARASGGRTLSPETRAACVASGRGAGGGPSEMKSLGRCGSNGHSSHGESSNRDGIWTVRNRRPDAIAKRADATTERAR